ncbi:uncharacterized protein LOC131171131 [Hevea brasiliensis]|uniref:uncharacterized protein LOC131171131 n=1 Tax=Hevea brasiliensis TaxID=3981 RepID=UPI0025D3FD32|nr:uncharacterized protein LOC131171131 [Hevea brasiliensis]
MACETTKQAWNRLKEEFQGSKSSKQMSVLNLRREFEVLKMKESKTLKEYTARLMSVVNKIILSSEDLLDKRVMEKGQQANFNDDQPKQQEDHLFMASQSCSAIDKFTWFINSGCTSHMARDESLFTSLDRSVKATVKMGNGEIVQAMGKATFAMLTKKGTKHIFDVLYILSLDKNLLSVAQMMKRGYSLSFKGY